MSETGLTGVVAYAFSKPCEGMTTAQVTANAALHIIQIGTTLLGDAPEWNSAYGIGAPVPASGIYRCTGCWDEITSNKGDKSPRRTDISTPT